MVICGMKINMFLIFGMILFVRSWVSSFGGSFLVSYVEREVNFLFIRFIG